MIKLLRVLGFKMMLDLETGTFKQPTLVLSKDRVIVAAKGLGGDEDIDGNQPFELVAKRRLTKKQAAQAGSNWEEEAAWTVTPQEFP